MPLLLVFAGGVAGGLWASGSAEGIAAGLKWLALAIALFVGAKVVGVI